MGEWRYSSTIRDFSTISTSRPCRFAPGERAPGTQEPVWTLSREKSRASAGNRTQILRPSSPSLYRLGHPGSYTSACLAEQRSQIEHIICNALCQCCFETNGAQRWGWIIKSRLDYKLSKMRYITIGRSLFLFLRSTIKHHFRLQRLHFTYTAYDQTTHQPYISRISAHGKCTANAKFSKV
jgi:hypothetical protein